MPNIQNNLGPGSTGNEVADLQKWLIQQGYSIPSIQNGSAQPGYYGAETQAAVTAWQKAVGVNPNSPSDYGYFGPLSRAAMAKGSTPTSTPAPLSGTGNASPGAAPAPQPIYQAPASQPSPQASKPNLPGFQTPSNGGQVQWLPQPQGTPGSGGSLLDFANALDGALQLGKEKRNAKSLEFMQGAAPTGTLMASDFNSILGNLNAASDNSGEQLTRRALELATPKYETMQIGDQLVQMAYDGAGKFLGGTPIAVLPPKYSYDTMTLPNGDVYYIQKDGSGKPIGQQLVYQGAPESGNTFDYSTDGSGNLIESVYNAQGQLQTMGIIGKMPEGAANEEYTYKTTYQDGAGIQWFAGLKPNGEWENIKLGGSPTTYKPTQTDTKKNDAAEYKKLLNDSKGPDNYVNTVTYVNALQSWDGTPSDFFKQFPPDMYLNPNDPTIPDYIKAEMSDSGNLY